MKLALLETPLDRNLFKRQKHKGEQEMKREKFRETGSQIGYACTDLVHSIEQVGIYGADSVLYTAVLLFLLLYCDMDGLKSYVKCILGCLGIEFKRMGFKSIENLVRVSQRTTAPRYYCRTIG